MTPTLTKINIEIGSTDSVKVSQTRINGSVISKFINIKDLPDLIKDSSSVTLKEKDTGYMPVSLIRDVVAQNQIRRLYYVPHYTFNFRFYDEEELPEIKYGNKYGICLQEDESVETDVLYIPNFKLRDVCTYIVNVNDTHTNIVRYNFGVLTTNMIGRVSDESGLLRVFPNHFDTEVCWGENTEVRGLLNNVDLYTQSNLHNHYFNSLFNTDIFPPIRFKRHLVEEYEKELLDFFSEVLEEMPTSDSDFLAHYLESYNYAFLTMYFFATVKDLRPVDFLSTTPSFTLGDVF